MEITDKTVDAFFYILVQLPFTEGSRHRRRKSSVFSKCFNIVQYRVLRTLSFDYWLILFMPCKFSSCWEISVESVTRGTKQSSRGRNVG